MNLDKIDRKQLLATLQCVSPGLSEREFIEQSSCFTFEKGFITTYNEEICCRAPSKLGKGFTGAVQASKLMDLLNKLEDDEIGFEIGEGELIISGVRKRAGIRMEKEVVLSTESVEEPTYWNKITDDFCEAIQTVSSCVSTDDSRFFLTCIHIHPEYIEACDNMQLTRYKTKTKIKREFLIKYDSAKYIVSLGMTEMSETDNWVHFKNSNNLILSCRRYLEEFPDLSKVLEVTGNPLVLPKGLAEAVEKADIFSSEQADNNKVLIDLKPGKLKVRGEGISGWYEQTKKINYTGEAITFRIAPKMITQIVKKHNDCVVNGERLKVDGGKFIYISVLSKPDEGNKETEEPDKKKEVKKSKKVPKKTAD